MIDDSLFLENDLTEIVAGLPPQVSNFAGQRILLAGGGGFLGRYFLAIFQKLNETYPGQDVCFFKQDETLFWFGIRR